MKYYLIALVIALATLSHILSRVGFSPLKIIGIIAFFIALCTAAAIILHIITGQIKL